MEMTTNARPEKRHRIVAACTSSGHRRRRCRGCHSRRLACVHRSWLAGVEDPAFVRRHLELSRARPSAAIVVPSDNR
uniref:Uncharacterized protein n=1 Tax=Oryza punctata TaxID=4537 RepID=A0A0E0KPR3_ORYPU